LLTVDEFGVVQVLQVCARLHREVFALTLADVFVDVLEDHVLETHPLGLCDETVQVQPGQSTVHHFEVLHTLLLHHIVTERYPTIVQLVDDEVDFLVEDVIP